MLALALVSLIVAQDAETPATSADAPPAAPQAAPQAPAMSFDDGAFNDGMSYYNRFEFEKASFRFRAATRTEGKPAAEVARAHLWLGLALAQAGDEIGARESFSQALALDGSVDLPADAPPTIRPLFDEARNAPQKTTSVDEKHVASSSPKQSDDVPLTTLVGAGVAGAGVIAFASGAVLGAVAISQADEAQKERFQDDAIAAHEQAAGTAIAANTLIAIGAAATVAGAAVVVAGPFLE